MSAKAGHLPQTSHNEYNGLSLDSVGVLGGTPKRESNTRIYIIFVVVLLIAVVATVFITRAVIDSHDTEDGDSSSTIITDDKPKNLIIIIGDGMGQSYNGAYRKYKDINRTTLDDVFKGRYSTTPTNVDGVTDSAAGATCFASRVVTHNGFIGVDESGNPKGSLLAAAKRQGKGTGVVVTKSVTDATPAAFTAHSMYRNWHHMIAEQQATRQIDGAPMLDLLMGGGRQNFERIGFFDNASMHSEYGWNSVTYNASEFIDSLDEVDTSIMPFMGLFADIQLPYYIDRVNGYVEANDSARGITEYPSLLQMTQKSINLLSEKYENDGFVLLVEASQVDLCGHENDIVCVLWEMEEMMDTVDWVLDFAENDGETLVVILADHETGGLTIGRDGSYESSKLINYLNGKMARNGNISGAWYSFDYDYSIDPPPDVSGVSNYGSYIWMPETVTRSRHTSHWFMDQIQETGNISTLNQLYDALETLYLGGDSLSPLEKAFMAENWNRTGSTPQKAIAMLMNARTLTGWTTHGHSGADVAVHAYGPGEDEFVGHWLNYEIGEIMSRVLGVEEAQNEETQYLEQLFMDGTLQICDASDKVSYVEWNTSVAYPDGNLKDGENCIDEWL